MNSKRPVNLNLATMKFPSMAIASILHRLSGLCLFLLMPVMLYFLSQSLLSQESFDQLHLLLQHAGCKWLLWVFSAALGYHVLAGIRHMTMDFGMCEHLKCAQRSALLVIILAIIATIFIGIWIW